MSDKGWERVRTTCGGLAQGLAGNRTTQTGMAEHVDRAKTTKVINTDGEAFAYKMGWIDAMLYVREQILGQGQTSALPERIKK